MLLCLDEIMQDFTQEKFVEQHDPEKHNNGDRGCDEFKLDYGPIIC